MTGVSSYLVTTRAGATSPRDMLQPIVAALSDVELSSSHLKMKRFPIPLFTEGSEQLRDTFFKEIPLVLQELEMAYRGGGGGVWYPHEYIRWILPHASAITITVTHPAISPPEVPAAGGKRKTTESETLGTTLDDNGCRRSARL